MSAVSNALVAIGRFVAGAEDDHHFDDQGYTTHHWLLPENAEIIYGGIAFAVILALGWKFKVVPMAKKAFAARTEKIQGELDESANAKRDAEAEAARIRQNLGNIDAERQRLVAEADAQAESLLADGRARLDAEVADLEARAETDLASVGSRSTDELRAEIARLASQAADKVVEQSLDDATIQSLIENYIANVGATGRA
jgi:F-type H+-transporting ATPase subunit b